MARILVVYYRQAGSRYWRSTYSHHLGSFSTLPEHEVRYLNAAWPWVPRYLRAFRPDAVILHYTFLSVRLFTPIWQSVNHRVRFLKAVDCPKALVPHDEQAQADRLCEAGNDYRVTHVFTPSSEASWPVIYGKLDHPVEFSTVLTGYVDEDTVQLIEARAHLPHERTIDIGYRAWASWPFYGRHGNAKVEVGDRIKSRAAEYALEVDISKDSRDALMGDDWFDFLLSCRYTLGVEGGSSVFDPDGTIAERTSAYMKSHPDAPFEQIEAACFPGVDGGFEYRLLGPRHLEAVMTRTGQILVEGAYGGVLLPGAHYLPLKRDFSNLDEVLEHVKDDELRARMVERAYRDIVGSGQWTYHAFAVRLCESLLEHAGSTPPEFFWRWHRRRNRFDTNPRWEAFYIPIVEWVFRLRTPREFGRDVAVVLIGEERMWRFMVGMHNSARRVTGQPPLEACEYEPSEAERIRRERRVRKSAGR